MNRSVIARSMTTLNTNASYSLFFYEKYPVFYSCCRYYCTSEATSAGFTHKETLLTVSTRKTVDTVSHAFFVRMRVTQTHVDEVKVQPKSHVRSLACTHRLCSWSIKGPTFRSLKRSALIRAAWRLATHCTFLVAGTATEARPPSMVLSATEREAKLQQHTDGSERELVRGGVWG